jgi:hypothetical protein
MVVGCRRTGRRDWKEQLEGAHGATGERGGKKVSPDCRGSDTSLRQPATVVHQKRGRLSPPFLAGAAAYRFLPPFFFPPLAVFFAIALYPPLRVGLVREEPSTAHRSAAADRHAGGAPAGAHRFFATPARGRARGLHLKKSGVRKFPCDTPGPAAAVSASSRPFSCRPSQSSSPLVPPWNVAAQLVTGDTGLQQVG